MGYDYNSNPMMSINSVPTSVQNDFSESSIAREVAQVQAAMMIAQKFPRNEAVVEKRIEQSCSRFKLASTACYTYSRGGTEIQGPSIRLAEALARSMGNIKYGIEEVSQANGESKVRAYAYDLETNTQAERIFVVKHERSTKKGKTALSDGRAIYELTANQGARRVRACILELIPADLVDFAVEKCTATVKANLKITPDSIAAMEQAFLAYGVTRPMIEAFIQRKLEAVTTDQFIRLRNIWTGLKDGISKVDDFFDTTAKKEPKRATEEAFAPKGEIIQPKAENKPQAQEEAILDDIPMDADYGIGPEDFEDDSSLFYSEDDMDL